MPVRAKKKKDERQFVVYNRKIGRVEPGIYARRVTIVKDLAFVHAANATSSADILPKECVFSTMEKAKQYATSSGIRRWVVTNDGYEDSPQMFEGLVKRHVIQDGWSGKRYDQTICNIKTGKVLEETHWGVQVFDNKRTAESAFSKRWNDNYKNALKNQREAAGLLRALAKCKPRSRKKK